MSSYTRYYNARQRVVQQQQQQQQQHNDAVIGDNNLALFLFPSSIHGNFASFCVKLESKATSGERLISQI